MNQNASSVIANALDDLPGDLRRAVIKEFEKGIQKDWVHRLRMRIDPTLYHAWGTKYGYDCWKDSQFLKEIERDNPEVRVKCGGTRLQVGWQGGTKRSSQKFTL